MEVGNAPRARQGRGDPGRRGSGFWSGGGGQELNQRILINSTVFESQSLYLYALKQNSSQLISQIFIESLLCARHVRYVLSLLKIRKIQSLKWKPLTSFGWGSLKFLSVDI